MFEENYGMRLTYGALFKDQRSWRLAPLSGLSIGSAWVLQGLWGGGLESDVACFDRTTLVTQLLIMSLVLSIRVSHFKHRGSGPPSPPKSLGDGHGTNGPLSPCLHQAVPSSLNHSLVIGCDHELRHSRHLFHRSGRLRKANAGPREWIYQSLSYRWCVPSPDRHRIHCSLTAGTKDLLSQPPSSRSLRR